MQTTTVERILILIDNKKSRAEMPGIFYYTPNIIQMILLIQDSLNPKSTSFVFSGLMFHLYNLLCAIHSLVKSLYVLLNLTSG